MVVLRNKKGHAKDYVQTFTKLWVRRLLLLLCIWVTWTYILATVSALMGFDSMIVQSLVELSGTAINVILGILLGYLCKSFFETREEKKNELEEKEVEREWEDGR